MSTKKIKNIWLGRLTYPKSISLMNLYRKKVEKDKTCVFILGMEIEDCISLGRRARKQMDVLKKTDLLIHETDRGGQASIHSKGQLVIYPILSLEDKVLGLKNWVYFLSQISSLWISEKIKEPCFLNEKAPGFYTRRGKIGFIGLCIKKQISLHGLAFNIFNDLDLFKQIRACGLKKAPLDRFLNYIKKEEKDLESLFLLWTQFFEKYYNSEEALRALSCFNLALSDSRAELRASSKSPKSSGFSVKSSKSSKKISLTIPRP